jgi:type II secretory pathway pseudopilin PulG
MSNRRLRASSGYSLVEMVVMMGVLTTVMTVTLSWIHASMKFSSAVKERAYVHQQLNRLSEDLRTRIAAAERIVVDGNTMKLGRKATEVRYTIKEGVLERQKLDLSEEHDAVSVEAFRIGRDVDARWGGDELPHWVSLTIKQRPVTRNSRDSASSISSLETPKLEWHLRAGPRKVAK